MRFLAVVVAASSAVPPAQAQELSDQTRELIRARLETVRPADLDARGDPVHASTSLPRFYTSRLFAPAWSGDRGPLPVADSLIAMLREADREGLRASDYHLGAIERTLREIRQAPGNGRATALRMADLDLLLTDAFLIYGSHLLIGRVNPETLDPEWRANRRGVDMVARLNEALSTGHMRRALESLLPPQRGYARLRSALARYREIAAQGGWPRVPAGASLSLNARDPRVALLRQRLVLAGDLTASAAASASGDPELFDAQLAGAVMRFQGRHGLARDGVVGPATLAVLNVPVETRVHQVELNMERWRWLPQDLGRRHILVNIAAFELDVIDSDTVALQMRVMVGRSYRRTPVFTGNMTYLVLAPYWHVPHNLAVQDQLPLIKRNASHLSQQRMQLLQGWGAETREVDPATVDWGNVTASRFPFRLRQEPGPGNALGRAKFMFPNAFNVYLHDTPARDLFDQPDRAFSSGCIRIEKPVELAEYLLRGDPRWTRESLMTTINRWQERTVPLPRPVPVHLLYWTAWAEDDGSIHFRNDIYGRDARLEPAIHSRPPADE